MNFHNVVQSALAGVTQWIEGGPENQKVMGSIPRQGPCPALGPGLQWGSRERQHTLKFLSLPRL